MAGIFRSLPVALSMCVIFGVATIVQHEMAAPGAGWPDIVQFVDWLRAMPNPWLVATASIFLLMLALCLFQAIAAPYPGAIGLVPASGTEVALLRAQWPGGNGGISGVADPSAEHHRLGDAAMTSGDLAIAWVHFEAGLAIREEQAAFDPGDGEVQRSISISQDRLGDVAFRSGDIDEARSRYAAALAIAERLAASDPDHGPWQRDLSLGHTKLGDVALWMEDLAEARSRFRAGLAIAAALAAREPDQALWQCDLSVCHTHLARLDEQVGDRVAALGHFEQARLCLERHRALTPGDQCSEGFIAWADAQIERLRAES
jgi:tetratricopeptide (TPR) repeat protein